MKYHRPVDLSTALKIRASRPITVLAGGSDILATTTRRDIGVDTLDLTAIDGLRGISETSDGWRIGAATTWSDIAKTELPEAFDALRQAALQIGSCQIQNRATIGGNLCNASPAADSVPPLLVLDAEVELSSDNRTRRLPLQKFIEGPRKTALQSDEIMTAVHVSSAAVEGCSGFEKLGARKYLVISICMAAVKVTVEQGVVRKGAIAVGACSPVALRLGGFEKALVGQTLSDEASWHEALRSDIATLLHPIDDVRANAGYRKEAAAEMVVLALREAADK